MVQDFRVCHERSKIGYFHNFDGRPAIEQNVDGEIHIRLNVPKRSNSIAWTDLSLEVFTVNVESNSRGTFQFDDGKMPSAFDARDCKSNSDSILATRFQANDIFLDSEIDVHR